MLEGRDLLFAEGGPGGDQTMKSALQHGTAAFVARLQTTSAASHLAEGRGMEIWKTLRVSHISTPLLQPRTRVAKGVTLTFHLVQKIGQVSPTCPNRVRLHECHGQYRCQYQTTIENGKSDNGRRIEHLVGVLPAMKIEAMKRAGSAVPRARKHLRVIGNPRIKLLGPTIKTVASHPTL
jgi:hypothetical protein